MTINSKENLFNSLLGIGQMFLGSQQAQQGTTIQAQTILNSGQISQQAAGLTAAGYRQAIKGVQGAVDFNVGTDRLNLSRQLRSLGRQATTTSAIQKSQVVAAGLVIGSKSALMLANENLDIISRQMKEVKYDAQRSIQAKFYEAAVQKTNLENQARAAEYRGEVARVQAQNQAAEVEYAGKVRQYQTFSKITKNIPSLISMFKESK